MRLRWRLAIAVLTVLAALVVAGSVWVARFQPLEPESSLGFGYQAGFNFSDVAPQVAFGLRNDSRVAVTITEVEAPLGAAPMITPDPEEDPFREEAYVPFEAFELGAGEIRWIALAWLHPMCRDAEPSGAWMSNVRVRFEVFSISRWTELDPFFDDSRVVTEEDGETCIQRS